VYTLERAIARARERGAAEALRLAKEGQRLLDELRDDIVDDLRQYDRRELNFHTDSIWPAETYGDWRRRIAEMIVRIQAQG
jgi:hypothetical protein